MRRAGIGGTRWHWLAVVKQIEHQDIYVIRRPGGPYRERLCPRS